MNEVTKPKRKPVNVDRIAIGAEPSARLDQWFSQLDGKYKGIKMKRNELVEWLILNRAASLNDDEIRRIGDKFYDQMDLAQWIVRQLKDAKATGKSLSIDDIMQRTSALK